MQSVWSIKNSSTSHHIAANQPHRGENCFLIQILVATEIKPGEICELHFHRAQLLK